MKRRLVVLALGVGSFLLFQLLLLVPGFVDAVYGRRVNPPLMWLVSRLTGIIPFSVAEFLIVGYVSWVLVAIGRAATRLLQHRRSWRNALASAGLIALRDAAAVIVLFYILWGYNYARPPLAERLGWPAFVAPDSAELIGLAERAVLNTNDAYRALHGTEDAGVPTMATDVRALDRAIDEGYRHASELLALPDWVGRSFGRVKQPIVLGPVLARFGVAGIFVPWTGEPHVVRQPFVRRASAIGHEKAHQRGISPELEASFLGYVAASLAPDPLARYAAAYFAQMHLLQLVPPPDRDRLIAMRLPGIERDQRDVIAWWAQFEGPTRDVGRRMNDQFLRANRVAGGVQNYGLVVRLLVEFHRQSGSLDPARVAGP